MTIEIKAPAFPESVADGEVAVWHKPEGDSVSRDELIVEIDVKPGSDPSCFNINGHGVVPVAIFGSATADATLIDTSTLVFAGLETAVRGKKGPQCSQQDRNNDGYLDLVCQFEDDASNWSPDSDSEGTLVGELFDGTPITGTGDICGVPQ